MEDFYGKKIGKIEKKNFEVSRIFFHRRRPSLKATEGSQNASTLLKTIHEYVFVNFRLPTEMQFNVKEKLAS